MEKTPRTIAATELAIGMEVLFPEGWSSHGMKPAVWSRPITSIRTEERFWIGTMIETDIGGFSALDNDGATNMVTVR